MVYAELVGGPLLAIYDLEVVKVKLNRKDLNRLVQN
jgi:hypothetical protein